MMSRKKSKSKKKDKPLYDENGKWVDQDMRVLGGIRRAYRVSPQMKDTLDAARVELPPALLKSGKPGKRNRVRFRCAMCGGLFSSKNVQVDHIEPATPLGRTIAEMSWDEVVEGIFCGVENLQVLCSTPKSKNNGLPSCHAKKSAEENWIRKRLVEIKKQYEDPLHFCKFTIELIEYHVDELKKEYKQYLEDKENERLAKEERKRIRLEKRAAKEVEKAEKKRIREEKRKSKKK